MRLKVSFSPKVTTRPLERIMDFNSVIVLLTFFLAWPQFCRARHSSRIIYQYPHVGTWFENAAARSNGDLLLTSLNNPGGLHSLNPFSSSKPLLVTNQFDGLNS